MGAKCLLLLLVLGTVISSYQVEGIFRKIAKYARNYARAFVGGARNYARAFVGGARDMWRNYNDMKKANTIGADKYFHAKGNYEAAKRGTGGKHAAAIISNAREAGQLVQGLFQKKPLKDLVKDMREDQRANKWGRSGGDPNRFRPKGLDRKYKK